jgi:uncharacterized FlgJ-related protein
MNTDHLFSTKPDSLTESVIDVLMEAADPAKLDRLRKTRDQLQKQVSAALSAIVASTTLKDAIRKADELDNALEHYFLAVESVDAASR